MTVTNGYCSVAELREHFGDPGTKLDAELLERCINTASRAIDEHCGRKFWLDATVTARVYRPDVAHVAWVEDIGTSTGLVVKTDTTGDGTYATTWAATDYQLEPLNVNAAADTAYAWWRITAVDRYTFPLSTRRTTLQVTAKFGWSAVPVQVAEACLLKAAALYKRAEAVFGVASFGDVGLARIGRDDPDVVSLLYPFLKHRVGAI